MGLFRKGKSHIIANLYRTDKVICSHSKEWKTLFYSRINTVVGIISLDCSVYMHLHMF